MNIFSSVCVYLWGVANNLCFGLNAACITYCQPVKQIHKNHNDQKYKREEKQVRDRA